MKQFNSILFFLLFLAHYGLAHGPQHDNSIRFIENKNQWERKVEYRADLSSTALFLEKNCFTYHLYQSNSHKHPHTRPQEIGSDSIRFKGHSFKVKFNQSNPDVELSAAGESEDHYNYYIGKNPAKWASGVKAFNSVLYQSLYNGIDLKVYSQNNNLKYDFIILPKVDPSVIRLEYEGLDRMSLNQGNLILHTSLGEVTEQKPFAYQYIRGQLITIPCKYVLEGNVVSFNFPSGYDPNFSITIDPVLIFSTYSGSTADNFGYTATPDSKGFLYGGSSVFDVGYPFTIGAYQTTFAGGSGAFFGIKGTDIGITKYDTSGTKRIYSTYLGGSEDEVPHSLIVNDQDELFIYGTTGSADFPFTKTAFDTTFNGGTAVGMNGIEVAHFSGCDIFVSKLNVDGTALLASTYLGGTGNDGALARSPASALRYNYADEMRGEIELDKSSNVYIASCTRSLNFPMMGSSFQSTYGGGSFDAVIVKMDENLENILWSTYLGGAGDDAAYSIELDTMDNPYISGGTNSINFPTTAGTLYTSFQLGLADGFISYLDQNTSAVIYSSYFGSPAYDQSYFVGLDRHNNVHLFGQTEATGANAVRFVQNAGFSQANSGQFISKLTPELDSIFWSTTFGTGSGIPNISPTAFLVDLCDKIYLSGWGGTPRNNEFLSGVNRPFTMLTTLGPNPATDFYQSSTDGHDFYLMVLEGDGSALNYASFFGGNISEEHVDGGTSRFDKKGKMYQAMCAGCGANSDMPIKPAFGSTQLPSTNNSFNCNIGIFKMDFRLPVVVAEFNAPDVCLGDSTHFNNTSQKKSATTFVWTFGDGTGSTLENPVHLYATGGTFTVQLIVKDSATCNLADTLTKEIYVSPLSAGMIEATADQYVIYKGKSTTLHALPPTGWQYVWSPSQTLSNATSVNPIATPPVTTTYTLTAADPRINSCRITDTVTIQVIEIICKEPYIYVPNAFTPNEDGKNELLYVRSANIRDLYFTIYNRWGEKVFETRDQSIGWDGMFKGMKADPGVFVYYVEGFCIDDQQFFMKGNITLIR